MIRITFILHIATPKEKPMRIEVLEVASQIQGDSANAEVSRV